MNWIWSLTQRHYVQQIVYISTEKNDFCMMQSGDVYAHSVAKSVPASMVAPGDCY